MIIKIKPGCEDEYISCHKNPWPEMLEAIRDAGFHNEIIWFYENQSIIYLECADHDAANARLRATEICKKWDIAMAPFFSDQPVMPEKIFDLNQQIHGELRPD